MFDLKVTIIVNAARIKPESETDVPIRFDKMLS
jgi:hypothetical protein